MISRGSWRWLLCLYTIATFVEAALFGELGAFMPLHLSRLDVPASDIPARLGFMYTITGLVGIPLLPLWGALADRYARQPVIVRSFALHVAACTTMALAPSSVIFAAGFAVTALTFGNTGLMTATLAERTPAGRSGFAITTMNSAAPVGAFLGPLVGGPAFDAFGLPSVLAVNTAFMLAIALLLTFGYVDPYRGKSGRALRSMAFDGVAHLVASPRLRTLFPALFVAAAGWMAALAFVPLAVTALYHGESAGTAVGLVSGAAGLGTLIFGPLIGALADHWGTWRVLLVSMTIAAALVPLGAAISDLVIFGVFWAITAGIRSAAFGLSNAVLASSADKAHRGRVMSFAFLPLNAGVTVGPLLASSVARANVFAVFPLAGALSAVGLLALWWSERQPVLEDAQ